MGALTQAMASAAKAAGAEIRTAAEVIEIRVKDGAATGVLLWHRRRNQRQGCNLQRRPQTHAAQADRSHASFARLRAEAAALPRQWHGGEGQPCALRPAEFHRVEKRRRRRAQGTHSHWPRNRLSRARLRRIQIRQLLAPSVSRSHDSIADRSHARARRQARDVDLHAVRAVQAERRLGETSAKRSAKRLCRRSRSTRRICPR